MAFRMKHFILWLHFSKWVRSPLFISLPLSKYWEKQKCLFDFRIEPATKTLRILKLYKWDWICLSKIQYQHSHCETPLFFWDFSKFCFARAKIRRQRFDLSENWKQLELSKKLSEKNQPRKKTLIWKANRIQEGCSTIGVHFINAETAIGRCRQTTSKKEPDRFAGCAKRICSHRTKWVYFDVRFEYFRWTLKITCFRKKRHFLSRIIFPRSFHFSCTPTNRLHIKTNERASKTTRWHNQMQWLEIKWIFDQFWNFFLIRANVNPMRFQAKKLQ